MIKKILFIGITIFTLLSCSSEKTYEFEIENNTEYNIGVLEFGCGFKKKSIEIPSNSKKTTKLIYKQNTAKFLISKTFKEPELCITILKYSDSTNNYTNSIGNALGINQFSKKNINRIEITDTNDKRYRFKIKVLEK